MAGPMRARLFSSSLQVLMLPVLLSVTACNVVGWHARSERSFSLEYRVHKGLDCAMLHDCGFAFEVSQLGELTRYEDPGTGAFTTSGQRMLTKQELDDLQQLLEETGFFDFPELFPTEGARAGGGSVVVTYVEWPAQTRKSVMMMTSDPLPETARTFVSRIDAFFAPLLQ